jgi:hypothetical protein
MDSNPGLEEQWEAQVLQLRAEADGMPPGREREETLRLARQLETAISYGRLTNLRVFKSNAT